MRAARGDLEALRGLEQGTLRLGSFPTASASLLAEGLKIVHQRWPAIEIMVRSALRPQLIDMLHTSEVELALMWSYSWTKATEQSLSLVPVATDRTVLLVAADSSPLRKVVSLPALRDLRWIIRHGQHPASEVLSRSCEAAGFAPHVVYGASDYQELQAMVAAGVGIAMVPELATSHHRPDVRILSFSPADRIPARSITMAALARRQYTPAMYAMSQAIHDAARTIVPSR